VGVLARATVAGLVLASRMARTPSTRLITWGMARSSAGGMLTSHKHQRPMLLMNSSPIKNGRIQFAALMPTISKKSIQKGLASLSSLLASAQVLLKSSALDLISFQLRPIKRSQSELVL